MYIILSFLLVLAACSITVQAQSNERSNDLSSTVSHIGKGLSSAVEWYDVPIAAAYLLRNSIHSGNIGDKIDLGPGLFETELSDILYSGSNEESFGSMDKDIIPDAIFYSRLTLTTAFDLFTDAEISGKEYQKIFLFKKTLLYTYTLTEYVKNLINRERPDGSDNRSFFSGHTSTTFAAATFLYRELDDFYDEWSFTQNDALLNTAFKTASFGVLYGWAGYVGYSRIHDKKHFISDVLAGAIAGTAVAYFLYDLYDDEPGIFNSFSILPSGSESLTLSFSMQF